GNRPPFLRRTWWAKDGRVFGGIMASDGLTETVARLRPGAAPAPVTTAPWNLSGCALARDAPILACLTENPRDAPEVGIVNIDSGAVTRLTRLNASLAAFQLAEVQPFFVRNRFGYETASLLVKPFAYRSSERYPLLVVLYNFGSRFTAQAQWIPNFPIQAFAR